MTKPIQNGLSPASSHQRQRGVVLVIALIVLVSMTLAAIGMSRSIDTANLVAGNLSFKQSALNAADKGIEAGYTWLIANSGTATLNSTNLARGYYSSRAVPEPDWTAAATWASSVTLDNGDADAAGNVISYIIQRMCTEPDTAYNGTGASGQSNQCAQFVETIATPAGGSQGVGATVFQGNPQVYYRITARSQGPKNTESHVQAMVSIPL